MNPGLLGEATPGVTRGGERGNGHGHAHGREGDWGDQDG